MNTIEKSKLRDNTIKMTKRKSKSRKSQQSQQQHQPEEISQQMPNEQREDSHENDKEKPNNIKKAFNNDQMNNVNGDSLNLISEKLEESLHINENGCCTHDSKKNENHLTSEIDQASDSRHPHLHPHHRKKQQHQQQHQQQCDDVTDINIRSKLNNENEKMKTVTNTISSTTTATSLETSQLKETMKNSIQSENHSNVISNGEVRTKSAKKSKSKTLTTEAAPTNNLNGSNNNNNHSNNSNYNKNSSELITSDKMMLNERGRDQASNLDADKDKKCGSLSTSSSSLNDDSQMNNSQKISHALVSQFAQSNVLSDKIESGKERQELQTSYSSGSCTKEHHNQVSNNKREECSSELDLDKKCVSLPKDLISDDVQKLSIANGLDSNVVIEYKEYESELQMQDIMRLIQTELSEPYSIYTYRYFIYNWPKLCFLAAHGNEYVGAIVCKLDMHMNVKRGYIAMLAVKKEYRKLKIGTNLVQKAIEAMLADDADEVVLETEMKNIPALRLYENLGFVRDKRLFRYYLNGVDALRLKLWFR